MCGQKWLKSGWPDPIPDKNWSKFLEIYTFSGICFLAGDNSRLGEKYWRNTSSISAILNLPMQIFEHMYGCQFRMEIVFRQLGSGAVSATHPRF
jgi:hypothetical protein